MDNDNTATITELTTHIIASYVSNNAVGTADLPGLIQSVYGSVARIRNGEAVLIPVERAKPAVSLKQAVQPDYVVNLFTGEKLKSLKRRLREKHNMTPAEYRTYWGLPADFPMVSPNYSAARSKLAKSMGLGQAGRKPLSAIKSQVNIPKA